MHLISLLGTATKLSGRTGGQVTSSRPNRQSCRVETRSIITPGK